MRQTPEKLVCHFCQSPLVETPRSKQQYGATIPQSNLWFPTVYSTSRWIKRDHQADMQVRALLFSKHAHHQNMMQLLSFSLLTDVQVHALLFWKQVHLQHLQHMMLLIS